MPSSSRRMSCSLRCSPILAGAALVAAGSPWLPLSWSAGYDHQLLLVLAANLLPVLAAVQSLAVSHALTTALPVIVLNSLLVASSQFNVPSNVCRVLLCMTDWLQEHIKG